MNSDIQSRDTQLTPPTGKLRQSNHKQKQRRKRALIAVGTALVLVAGGAVIALVASGGATQPPPVKSPSTADVLARPKQSPPQDLIAAGQVAVSGFYTTKVMNEANGDAIGTYTWSLYNETTKHYQKTDWAWVDVAPGMRTAAVLERDLPADRVGLVNMATGKVQRWIKVDKEIGGVQFSPDGKRLVATTYRLNPDGLYKDSSYRLNGKKVPGPKPSRTGFYIIDLATSKANFSALSPRKDGPGAFPGAGRQDLQWGRDGKLLWEPAANKDGKVYYDDDAHQIPVPKREASLPFAGGVLSPDGTHITGKFAGEDGQIVSEILNARTGKRSALVPGQQMLAWADNDHLIAWRCDPKQCDPGKGEFRNQLILVGVNGEKAIPLSGFRHAKLRDGSRWTPILSER